MIKRICEQCGKKFERKKSKVERSKRNFCSPRCWDLWRSKNQRRENSPHWKGGKVGKNCGVCGEEFQDYQSSGSKLCSRKCQGIWHSENFYGENGAGWKGGNAKLHCEICEKEFEVRPHLASTARFCTRKCWYLWQAENRRGKNNPHWQGGTSFEPYPPEFNDILKRKIRRRDNHTCAISGEPGRDVHHIDYDKTNCLPRNLITLCASCHGKTNTNRKYWENFLSPIAIARTQRVTKGSQWKSGKQEIM